MCHSSIDIITFENLKFSSLKLIIYRPPDKISNIIMVLQFSTLTDARMLYNVYIIEHCKIISDICRCRK